MKRVDYLKFRNMVNSFEMSTNLEIGFKNETYTFCRLNSPYISHGEMEINKGHGVSETIILCNDSYDMIVSKNDFLDIKNSIKIKIPSYIIRRILRRVEVIDVLKWLSDKNIVNAYIPDNFIGYDKNGGPKYRSLILNKEKMIFEEVKEDEKNDEVEED